MNGTLKSGRIRRLARRALMLLPAVGGLIFVAVLLWPAPSESPAVIRVGVLPDQSPEILQQRYAALLDYLEKEVGVPFQLVMPGDYAELLDMFGGREVDIAYFGGLTYLMARERSGARGLVMRDVDTRFRSVFLATTGRPESTIADFLGKRLAFGARLSTSGHLMPRHFMTQSNIDPESWFSDIVYTGAHDATARLVRDGEVDLGVANAEIVEAMYRDGRLRRDDVRIVDQTPPYVDYVWAMRPQIDPDLYDKVVFAFLKLSPSDAPGPVVLGNMGAGGFLPFRDSEFGSLREIAVSLGLLR